VLEIPLGIFPIYKRVGEYPLRKTALAHYPLGRVDEKLLT